MNSEKIPAGGPPAQSYVALGEVAEDQYTSVPAELKERPQWVVWRYERRKGKLTKVPYNGAGVTASTADPKTWCTFETALQASTNFEGIGYVFAPDDPYCGVDLDKVLDPETGELEAEAQSIVSELNSYSELSPSGLGLHVIVRGKLPADGRRRGFLEVYDKGRYFTFTGKHWSGAPTTVEDRQAELEAVYHRTFKDDDNNGEHGESKPAQPNDLTDQELIEKATRAKDGSVFASLWSCDSSAYTSASEADLALCNRLAFWTGRDPERMDRLFRQSGLMRGKWDEKRGTQTYGEITIAKAIAGCSKVYTPPAAATSPSGFALRHISEFERELKGAQYLIKPFLERDTITILFGDSDTYKSFLLFDWVLSVGYGVSYHGYPTHQGPVVLIVGEGAGGIGRRIAAWKLDNGIKGDAPVYISAIPAALIEAGEAEKVAEIVAKATGGTPPALIGIDTLSANMGDGDESDNADIAKFLRNVAVNLRARFQACVVIVHHVGHSEKKRERGAYAIRANADARIRVERQEGSTAITVTCEKAKDSERWEPVSFAARPVVLPGVFDSEGEAVSSLVLDQSECVQRQPIVTRLGPNQQKLLGELRSMYDERQSTGDDALVPIREWAQRALESGAVRNPQRFYDTRKSLEAHGLIRMDETYVYLTGGEQRTSQADYQ